MDRGPGSLQDAGVNRSIRPSCKGSMELGTQPLGEVEWIREIDGYLLSFANTFTRVVVGNKRNRV